MKKILMLGMMACIVTACQTMDNVKTGFSDSLTSVGNLFSSKRVNTPCPAFMVSEELDNYYDIPGTKAAKSNGLTNATIENISGECRMNANEDIVTVSLDIDFAAQAGGEIANTNSDTPQTLEIPYFIAVLNADQEILAKDTFTIPLEISGAEKRTYHKERLQQNIPFLEESDPSTYTIITGFQLNEPQLAYAKQAEQQPTLASATPVAKVEPAAGSVQIDSDKVVGADPFAGR